MSAYLNKLLNQAHVYNITLGSYPPDFLVLGLADHLVLLEDTEDLVLLLLGQIVQIQELLHHWRKGVPPSGFQPTKSAVTPSFGGILLWPAVELLLHVVFLSVSQIEMFKHKVTCSLKCYDTITSS